MERANIEKTELKSVVEKISSFVQERKKIILGLCGGRSVQKLFHYLKEADIEWKKVHIFMVDERIVPLEHEESNFRMLKLHLLDYLIKHKNLPEKNIHPYDIKKYNPKKYSVLLKKHGGKFDIAIFGVGEDGHIAALFPNLSILNEGEYFFEFDNSPKPPKHRMTASRKLILKTELGVFLFIGESKKHAFNNFNSNIKIEDCPAKIAYKLKKSIVVTDL